ncbi:MAG: RNA pseudouridine synthase [Burkholderiaceae bacterium]
MLEEGIRLAKRVADMLGCSRREAELYIEGGWVTVEGKGVELPQARVEPAQRVEILPDAKPVPLEPVTLVLNKPPGYATAGGGRQAASLLVPQARSAQDKSGLRVVQKHFRQLECVGGLETAASGLVVFSQDARVMRKLLDEAVYVEHEIMVEVQGQVAPAALAALNRPNGKVSISRQQEKTTGLRFAVKGLMPGRLAQVCDEAGLVMLSMKRLRLGSVGLAGLPEGQWRYLSPGERF